MAEATSTPRITAQYLDNYVGKNVMLVGKVVQLRGDSAVLDADGNVTAILNRDVHLTNGNGAQIVGKVNPDLSIKVLSSRDLGSGVAVRARVREQQVTIPATPRKSAPAPVTRPATVTASATQQQQQQQKPPQRELRYHEPPPTPEPLSSGFTQKHHRYPAPQTPYSQAQRRYPETPPKSSQRQRQHHQQESSDVGTSIARPPSRPSDLQPTPPSPETFKATTRSKDTTSGRSHRDGRERRHRRQKPRPKEPEVGVNEVVDDSELLGAIMDGIGRMTVGTVAMRMDDAGRWRIRRDSGDDST
ncbi:replication factor A protein 3 [Colletotrichum kahawae]|uniref:Replication factor A protein 3 n=1 Tax=Colletotrichum kahawae TaxID=34407 RepID=A0AAD9YER5_COLKA|nr:replication factor A protein 3 [Colletotrichum kahawae]